LIVETRKKGKYARFLAYIYYSTEHDDFEGIIRNGKMINEELVRVGLAERYD
jgi:endonuclease YncB( thermonuclease family)